MQPPTVVVDNAAFHAHNAALPAALPAATGSASAVGPDSLRQHTALIPLDFMSAFTNQNTPSQPITTAAATTTSTLLPQLIGTLPAHVSQAASPPLGAGGGTPHSASSSFAASPLLVPEDDNL